MGNSSRIFLFAEKVDQVYCLESSQDLHGIQLRIGRPPACTTFKFGLSGPICGGEWRNSAAGKGWHSLAPNSWRLGGRSGVNRFLLDMMQTPYFAGCEIHLP
jgi:hypothetical protein